MKYRALSQLPYCCVPTCILMILQRRGIKCGNQEEIGWELGLIVPFEYKKRFRKVRTGQMPSSGYGTRVNKNKYSINRFLSKIKSGLQEEYVYTASERRGRNLILENSHNDIIVCFNNGRVTGKGKGHVCLIKEIKGNKVMLLDPSKNPNRVESLEKLMDAIKYHGRKNRAGFWIIKEKD